MAGRHRTRIAYFTRIPRIAFRDLCAGESSAPSRLAQRADRALSLRVFTTAVFNNSEERLATTFGSPKSSDMDCFYRRPPPSSRSRPMTVVESIGRSHQSESAPSSRRGRTSAHLIRIARAGSRSWRNLLSRYLPKTERPNRQDPPHKQAAGRAQSANARCAR